MSVATRCITAGSYLFGTAAVSGLLWANTIDTWAGRLWVLCIVASALCVLSTLFIRTQVRILEAFQLGTELGALAVNAAHRNVEPTRRHLAIVGDTPSET